MTIWTALLLVSLGVPIDFLTGDNKNFNLEYEVSGGYPLPPDDSGATCDEHHMLKFNSSQIEIKSFCGGGSIRNEGRVLYSKIIPMTLPMYLNIISKIILSEISSPNLLKRLEEQVSDDQRISLNIASGSEKRTMSASRKNSRLTSSVDALLDTLDNLFESIFYM